MNFNVLLSTFKCELEGGAEHPGREFFVADCGGFAYGFFAAGDGDDFFKNSGAHLLKGFGAVEDGAGVEVHVVAHAVEHGGIGGNFDAGGGFAAVDAAAAGGEAADGAAAAD